MRPALHRIPQRTHRVGAAKGDDMLGVNNRGRSQAARRTLYALIAATSLVGSARAQPTGRGPHGPGPGARGAMDCERGAMMAPDASHRSDMMLIHQLFADGAIRRTVREIPGGVETETESSSA